MTAERDEAALTEEFAKVIQTIPLRIELSIGFTVNGTIPTARFFTQNERNRWVEFKPFLAAHEGEDRADLLETIAQFIRYAEGQTHE